MAEKEKGGVRLDVPDPDDDGGSDNETEESGMRSRYHIRDIFDCFNLVVNDKGGEKHKQKSLLCRAEKTMKQVQAHESFDETKGYLYRQFW